ncbi:MAG: cell division protein FtsQ/DivIB [Rhodobacteraceae bacterium]|nr:cell division protein FtsQ/DivIB [Paracoccaceae bacterium]
MQQMKPLAHDPSPSRLSYRLQRWMLTPGIRMGLRIVVPFGLTLAIASVFLSDDRRRDALSQFVIELRADIQERPEFMVSLMAIDGAGLSLAQEIREAVPLDFPTSSFDLDLEQIRQVVTGLDPVKAASVRIRPGGLLQIDVTERRPVVVWRTRDGLAILDRDGVHVGDIDSRSAHPDLPLIAGAGADKHVAQALQLMASARPLGKRLRGFVRVGMRRWDVVLDRDQRILLPGDYPVRALERVIVLNQGNDLLERDVTVVDMRLGERPTLRMSSAALKDWWRIRKINGDGQ